MLAVAMLMTEHAIIARARGVLAGAVPLLESGMPCPAELLFDAGDFARGYVEECHHQKEERVLFAELLHKRIPREMAETIKELTQEHRDGEAIMAELAEAARALSAGDETTTTAVVSGFRALVELHPGHAAREEKLVYLPAAHYFNDAEQRLLVRNFEEHDRLLVHHKYQRTIACWETRIAALSGPPPGE